MKTGKMDELRELAKRVRRDIIRMIGQRQSGHPGGSLSLVEILVSLYFEHMRHDPGNPKWPARDRFVLSKGHAAPALYAVLAECGYFERSHLGTFRRIGSILQGHPDSKKTPGVDASTGSLGQGFSVGCGMALGAKILKKDIRIYVVIGDGEMNEGQVWEAAMSASHLGLGNLTVIVDCNGYQNDGSTKEVMRVEPVVPKWEAFGWDAQEIDGHDFGQILQALRNSSCDETKPSVLVANTVKGRGVSYMEGSADFHGTPPTEEQMKQALEELA